MFNYDLMLGKNKQCNIKNFLHECYPAFTDRAKHVINKCISYCNKRIPNTLMKKQNFLAERVMKTILAVHVMKTCCCLYLISNLIAEITLKIRKQNQNRALLLKWTRQLGESLIGPSICKTDHIGFQWWKHTKVQNMYSFPIVIDKVYLKVKLNEKKINVEKARKHIIWNKIWFKLPKNPFITFILGKQWIHKKSL